MLIITGVRYEIELEPLYFVYVVDAIPSLSSVEKSLIEVTEIRNDLNINNNEIYDEFTRHMETLSVKYREKVG